MTIRRMATVTKRMLPLKLSAFKSALYALTGRAGRTAAAASAAAGTLPPRSPTPMAGGAAPLAFRGGASTLERVVEDIEADIAASPRIPNGPSPLLPPAKSPAPRSAGALADKRRSAGLRPGQLDPASLAPLSRREQELLDRKVRVGSCRNARAEQACLPSGSHPTGRPHPLPRSACQCVAPRHAGRSLNHPLPSPLARPQSYLRNFWYAAALSSAVTDDKPLGVDILGGRITLFRDQETGEVRRSWGLAGGRDPLTRRQPSSACCARRMLCSPHGVAPAIPSGLAAWQLPDRSWACTRPRLPLPQVKCIDDWCPHRGAPLSGGQVAVEPRSGHTCVVCPYQ